MKARQDGRVASVAVVIAVGVKAETGESNRTGKQDIHLVKEDGTDITRLTYDLTVGYSSPAWSPDGEKMTLEDSNHKIYIMNADGSGLTRLRNTVSGDRDPTFTPDGKKIAFTGNPISDDEIFVMNLDGTDVVNLTNSRTTHDSQPTFSPDGEKMAFRRNWGEHR